MKKQEENKDPKRKTKTPDEVDTPPPFIVEEYETTHPLIGPITKRIWSNGAIDNIGKAKPYEP